MTALRNILSALIVVIGFVALTGAIWIGLPILEIDLLARPDVRVALIVAIAVVLLGIAVVRARARRRAAAALEVNLLDGSAGDGTVLAERMKDAVEQLKQTGGPAALYDLPWYVLIGPPGAGKTTALLHSGLEFPGSDPEGIAGFGGTRNCDFWFARDAILIDTAGRYTTQDSDAQADKASWATFLSQLKAARPDQPINGVILTLSCADLMTAGEAGLRQHAETVRARLEELRAALRVRVPVYVMFTKADMVAGFREYFGSFDEARRRVVWGATFQQRKGQVDLGATIAREFQNLVTRLTDEVTDRMAEELDSATRIAAFGFPGQVAMLESAVGTYLTAVFGDAKRAGGAVLRGFYFTSGTQEGSPIDQVLGAYAASPGATGMQTAFMTGRGRSYFLHDLLSKVIFAERGWAGQNRMRMLRRSMARGAVKLSILTATLAAAGAMGYSFWNSATFVRTVDQQTRAYAAQGQRFLSEQRIDNAATRPILPALAAVRMIPGGYGNPVPEPDLPDLGLDRADSVEAAAVDAYSKALEQMLRPRMMLLAERRLAAALTDGSQTEAYDALKVYILLAKEQDGRDDDLAIQSYFARAWSDEYATPGSDADYRDVNGHLAAMLALDDRVSPWIKPNKALVDRAREDLADMPLADRLFGAMEAEAGAMRPLVLGKLVPGLRATDGRPAETIVVPGFYTFEGYWQVFQPMLANTEGRIAAEAWVLGPGARAVGGRSTAVPDLQKRYALGFEAAWAAALDRVAGTTPQDAVVPLVEVVAQHTALTRASAVTGQGELSPELKSLQDLVGAVPQSVLRRAAEQVQAPLQGWLALARGPLGARPVDQLVATLDAVAADPARWPDVVQQVGNIPPAVGRIVGQSGVMGARGALVRDVTGVCQQRILPFYPFASIGSAPLKMADFAAFFGYGGQVDRFWRTYGAVEGPVALPMSDAVRADFEAIEGLRAGLFADGSRVPDLGLRFGVARLSDGVQSVALDLGQGPVLLEPGGPGAVARWPAEVQGVDLLINEGLPSAVRARVPGGAWSLLSLIRGAQDVTVRGNRAELGLQVGDLSLRLSVEAEGLTEMPLASSVWRDFVCPEGLE